MPECFSCPKCRQDKAPSEFGRSNARSTGRPLWCRACKATYDQDLYRHSPDRKHSIQANNKTRAIENAKRVFLFLLAHPCQDCGEKDPVVLEFDQVSGDKSSAITDMVRGGAYRWATIATEIEKYRPWRDLREPVVGIEPTTPSLRVRCSTPELHRQFTPVEALRKHFDLGEDGTFRNQTAIRDFLAPATSNREVHP